MTQSSALVLGANGQDGTFLCHHLRARGYEVHAVARDDAPRIDVGQHYHRLDLRSDDRLAVALTHVRPSLVFHVAAVHNRAGLPYEGLFGDMLHVNVQSVHTVLEHIRAQAPETRLLYASSAKVFGAVPPTLIDEATPRRSDCLYSLTKNTATDLIEYYRRNHNVRASVLYLFNHESELRPPGFFIPKLVASLARASLGVGVPEEFETLDFFCDWGSAEEYMDIAIDILEREPGEDFVVATGTTWNARALAQRLFAARQLTLDDWVRARRGGSTSRRYQVRTDKLGRLLGRVPSVPIDALCERLVQVATRRTNQVRPVE